MARELNSFGEDVYGLSGSIKLDSSVKKILSYRPILANILKDSCTDFSKFNVDEIISMIDRIHMESIPVGPGQTNDPIRGENRESTIPGEGEIRYDIRFNVASAEGDGALDRLIDLEPQYNARRRSYDFETRGIAYCCRMVSEQLGYEVLRGNHYERIHKVKSIWILMESSQQDSNTLSEYAIREVNHIGECSYTPRTDLMSTTMIRLPKDDEWEKAKNPPTRLMELLSTLLSNRIAPDEKIGLLENKFAIACTSEFVKEVHDMCNYSEMIAERAAERAAKKAAERTTEEVSVRCIRNLMEGMHFTADRAMDVLKIPEDKRALYTSMLEEENIAK